MGSLVFIWLKFTSWWANYICMNSFLAKLANTACVQLGIALRITR